MNKKSKMSKVAWLYVFIALFITALSFFSATLAWYIRTKDSTLGIQFANPVVVDISTDVKETSVISGGNVNSLKPGSKVSVNTGIKMGANSSNAYVRAKITLMAEELRDENGNVIFWDNYVTVASGDITGNVGGVTPIESSWQEVTFYDSGEAKKWYVCKLQDGVARELKKGDPVTFYVGDILISPHMDNRFAEKTITIAFVVESIQTEGVVDPIACGEWGKLK